MLSHPIVPRRRIRLGLAAVSTSIVLLAAGCADVDDDASAGGEGEGGTLTVFAAASLTESFGELKEVFEAENPDTQVEFNFAGSSELAQQINEGAPADVFASANPANMELVVDEDNAAGDPEIFVENTLEIAVPPDNPADVTELADLADDSVTVALCAPDVPCGDAAETVMDVSGVQITPETLEEDVKAALTKVELDEVDAALVYRTDVVAADGAVTGIEFPESEDAINDYPIVDLAEAPEPELAAAWIELVLSEAGQEVLTEAGFRTP